MLYPTGRTIVVFRQATYMGSALGPYFANWTMISRPSTVLPAATTKTSQNNTKGKEKGIDQADTTEEEKLAIKSINRRLGLVGILVPHKRKAPRLPGSARHQQPQLTAKFQHRSGTESSRRKSRNVMSLLRHTCGPWG